MSRAKFNALDGIESAVGQMGVKAGSRGIVTPEMIDSWEPDRIAKLINGLTERANMDSAMDARRRARRVLLVWMIAVSGVVCLLTVIVMLVFFSPFTRLAAAIEQMASQRVKGQ